VYRDSNGFIWTGTKRGLNRFDGYNVINFESNSDDSLSLSNNIINCITEDNQSNLWIGTGFGISIMNSNTNRFTQINLLNHNALNCNDINYITTIQPSSNGEMYIGTHEGFFIHKDGQYIHHLIDSLDFMSSDNYILSFEEDRSGNIWIGSNSRNLFCLEKESGNLRKFVLSDLYDDAYASGLYYLFLDNDNKLWIGTQAGLFVLDISKNECDKNLNRFLNEKIGNKIITGIQADRDNNIWISTDGAGLFVINENRTTSLNIAHQVSERNSLATNGIHSLLIDSEDIVWVGTYKKGLDYYKRNTKKFMLLRHHPDKINSLGTSDINCILEDSNEKLWAGTNGKGISILDRKTQSYKHIRADENKRNSLSSDVVVSLFEDSRKNIWIGTYFGGVNKYNPATGKIGVYKHSDTDSTSISDDRVWSITEDRNNNIWISTMGGGLNKFLSKTNSFKRYTTSNSNIPGDYVNHIFIDSKNRLWLSSTDGLGLYNETNDNFEVFINPTGFTGNNTFGILVSAFEDSRGWLWLCGSNGLIQFNYEEKTASYINTDNGLLANPVNRVLEDKYGNLWLSSSTGLTKITFTSIISKENFSIDLLYFDETDGLQNNEFSETVSLKTSRGELIFGGVNGLNIFNPDEMKVSKEEPNLTFINLKIFNEVVNPNEVFNNRVVLEKTLNNTDEIELEYSENFFSIEFASLSYLSPDKNRYRYRLVGFEENWFETEGLNNFATYTNLDNGYYVFQVNGANADGSWNEKEISLKIVVLPPLWKRWYAFVFYVGIITLMLFVLRFIILSRERLNVEIEHGRFEAQRIHELDLSKLKFFTNISHELRTPLSLILLPVEKLLPKYENSPDGKYINHIYQNSKKLLYLINQLLDFRKMDVKGLSYKPSHENVIASINEAVASFYALSEDKNISLRLVTDIKELKMLFDKDKLEKILYNLLSNAFKYTPTNGLVLVEVNVLDGSDPESQELNKRLVIKVKDNGIGIRKDLISKIFTRFYQAENPIQISDKGTGIGLSLVQEYVSVHKGEIEVESAVGVGTCFSVYLPIEGEGDVVEESITKTTVLESSNTNQQANNHFAEISVPEGMDKPVILIVEDNDELRAYLKESLSVNYSILEAENGRQAWAILQSSMPDVVLSDIMMPEMDGIELCKLAKNNNITCHIPFIFLTAKITEEQQLTGLEVGADNYVSKPFNIDILEVKIRNVLQLKLNIRKVLNTKLQINPKDISITSLDEEFMQKALDIIDKNLGSSDFTVEEFSKEMGISRMHLYKKLVSLTGKPPLEFMRIFRLKRAVQLLQKSQLTIAEIAYKVGYNDPKNFSKHFKKEFNVLPSKYERRVKA
jgi:signal transduction histidine kinase/ligand-binding sensor domain-containing protein/AraC-like DNA-binding protein